MSVFLDGIDLRRGSTAKRMRAVNANESFCHEGLITRQLEDSVRDATTGPIEITIRPAAEDDSIQSRVAMMAPVDQPAAFDRSRAHEATIVLPRERPSGGSGRCHGALG